MGHGHQLLISSRNILFGELSHAELNRSAASVSVQAANTHLTSKWIVNCHVSQVISLQIISRKHLHLFFVTTPKPSSVSVPPSQSFFSLIMSFQMLVFGGQGQVSLREHWLHGHCILTALKFSETVWRFLAYVPLCCSGHNIHQNS